MAVPLTRCVAVLSSPGAPVGRHAPRSSVRACTRILAPREPLAPRTALAPPLALPSHRPSLPSRGMKVMCSP